MSSSTKPLRRATAVLKLPDHKTPQWITYASSIVRAMTKNPSFPAPVPPLADVDAAIADLAEAHTATLTKAVGTVSNRNDKRAVLKSRLQQLRSHVQAVADATPANGASIIESSGMSVKKPRPYPPRVFSAKPGRVSGTVDLVAPQAAGRAGYEWAYSVDAGKTWTLWTTTVQTRVTVTGLTPGQRVPFRYRAVTKDGRGDWSDPVALIVD
jgi:hypothetical protein